MTITEAQLDLRRAYVGAGPGVMISGLVWTIAAWAQHSRGIGTGFALLFFGGMLIYPLSKTVCRLVFRRDNESAENPLGMSILEGTLAMIGGLFAAYLFLGPAPEMVFPLAAIAVGTHYFLFKTAYGERLFWLLALIITAIGVGDIYIALMHGWTAPLVAATELVFGLVLTVRATAASKAANEIAG